MLDFHRHRGVFLGSQAVTAPLACFSSDLISQRLCDTYARHAATPVLLTWGRDSRGGPATDTHAPCVP